MILVAGAAGSNGFELTKLLASRGVPLRHGPFDRPGKADCRTRRSRGRHRRLRPAGKSQACPAGDRASISPHRLLGTGRSPANRFRAHRPAFGTLAYRQTFAIRCKRNLSGEVPALSPSGGTRDRRVGNRLCVSAAESLHARIARLSGLNHCGEQILCSRRRGSVDRTWLQGRVYDLTGPEALSQAEMAARISKAVGRSFSFIDGPPEAMRDALLGSGLPLWQADGLVEDYAHYRRGEASMVSSGVRDATGKQP